MDKVANVAAAAVKMKKGKNTECVKVVLRCRPMNRREREDERKWTLEIDEQKGSIQLFNPKMDDSEPPKSFTFDGAFGECSKQCDVYAATGFPIVEVRTACLHLFLCLLVAGDRVCSTGIMEQFSPMVKPVLANLTRCKAPRVALRVAM